MRPITPVAAWIRGAAVLSLLAGIVSGSLAWGAEARGPSGLRKPLEGPAPPFALPDLEGATWNVERLRGKPTVLVFGEAKHENTMAALAQIQPIVVRLRESGTDAFFALITSTRDPSDAIRAALKGAELDLPVLLDAKRESYSAYRVIVLPTTVILDVGARVVTSVAGRPIDLVDRVTDGLMVAAEKLSREEYDRIRTPPTRAGADVDRLRAVRHARLAERLAQRGFPELARDEFKAALELDEACTLARVGLGRLHIARQRLEEAEAEFQKALETAPQSLDAALGLASVEVLRGGTALDGARKRLERILTRVREDPEALFLLGRIAEAQEDPESALDYYRRAAMRALQEAGRRSLP